MNAARRRRLITFLGLTGVALLHVLPLNAAEPDPRKERERVRREQAALAAQMNLLRSEDAQVESAVAAMNRNVVAEERRLADARQRVEAADRQLIDATGAERRAADALGALRADLRAMAISAFIGGGRPVEVPSTPSGRDLSVSARREALQSFVVGSAEDAEDRLAAARQDLQFARTRAEEAAAAAAAKRSEADARLRRVAAARDEQAAFAARLDDRIEAKLAEAASLARLDQDLSAAIQRQQQALAQANRGRRTITVSPSVGGTRIPLRVVRGIQVHADIADALERLLAAADADGITLGGAGYRDSSDQQRLREAHCPDPASTPAAACRPPTARPGQSMHEQGLAIDFTYQGRIISTRSSPAYQWLEANAGRFGLSNLPTEPWHWSTNGN